MKKVIQGDEVGKTQKEQIEYYIDKWKDKLGLKEYTVEWIREPKRDEMGLKSSYGSFISLDEELRRIKIGIQTKQCHDFELTIVHELLHALFEILRYEYVKAFEILSNEYLEHNSKIEDSSDAMKNYNYYNEENAFCRALGSVLDRNTKNKEHPFVYHLATFLVVEDRYNQDMQNQLIEIKDKGG